MSCLTRSESHTARLSSFKNYVFVRNVLTLLMIWWSFGNDLVMIWWWFGHDLEMIWWWFGHDLEMICSWFGHDLLIIWLSFVHDFQNNFTKLNQELNPYPASSEAIVIPRDYPALMIMYWQGIFWLCWWFGDDLVMIWW